MVEEEDALVADPIGNRLKEAREAQGMSLDDVASKTRVPIRHLQHIENGEWDALPAATYSVGFARAYANVVGLNGAEIGTELRSQLGTAAQNSAKPSIYEPADPARVPPRSLALVAAVIAVLLAISYLVWRSGAVDDTAVDESEIAGVVPAEDAASAEMPLPDGPPLASSATATGPVVLTATEDVWLRVYEAQGSKLFENMLKAGQRYEVPPTASRPQILTGKPNALRVTVGTTEIPTLGPAEKTISDVSLLPADLIARAQASPPVPAPAPAPVPPAR